MVPGDGTFALGWTDSNGQYSSTVFVADESGSLVHTSLLNAFTVGMAASRSSPNLLRRIGDDFSISGSQNSGLSWQVIGTVPSTLGSIYSAAFDLNNVNRIAVAADGVQVSNNGGTNWTTAAFDVVPTTGTLAIFDVVFSTDGSIIWAHGRNPDEDCCGSLSQGRHLWRSSDGGQTFTSVAIQDANIVIGTRLVPHPTDPDIVYWANGRITDPFAFLFRYSHATGMTIRVELTGVESAQGLAFNPLNPQYMYFGLFWP